MEKRKGSRGAADLPAPAPGKQVVVRLEAWGEYKRLHGLAVVGVRWDEFGRLMVEVRRESSPTLALQPTPGLPKGMEKEGEA